MSYKVAFYTLLVMVVLVMIPGAYFINKKLDKTDKKVAEYILDDQITKYVDAGWLPYEKKRKKK